MAGEVLFYSYETIELREDIQSTLERTAAKDFYDDLQTMLSI